MGEKKPGRRSVNVLLIAYVSVIALGTLLIIVTLPKIMTALDESGMTRLVKERLLKSGTDNTTTNSNQARTIYFVVPQSSGFAYQPATVMVPQNLPYHQTVEALLKGPSVDALALGSISCIPASTRLIGLTVSQQIAYIDFTREFTNETVWGQSGKDAAIEQIRRTMRSFTGIRDIVILVEGNPVQSDMQ